MKYLGPLTKSGYVRIGMMLLGFYFSVQWLTGGSKLDQAVLIEDLRTTAQTLAQIANASVEHVPATISGMQAQGLMSEDLVDRCVRAKVNFLPENAGNRDGLAVFLVPGETKMTRVTATGLVLR
jgi:hypothetical protein